MATIHQSNPPPASVPKRERKPAWELTLYVAGQTPKSIAAFKNLKKICEEYLAGQYSIEVVDLLKEPQLAKSNQILAIPTIIRKCPLPIRKVVGDLTNLERALSGLGLPEAV